MRLQVDITEDDWLTSLAGSRIRYAFSVKMLIIYGVLIALTGGLLFKVVGTASGLVETIIANLDMPPDVQLADALAGMIVLLAGIAGLVFMGFLWTLMFRDQGAVKKGVTVKSIKKGLNTGPTVFDIESDALTVRHPAHTNRYSWRMVKRVEKTSAGLILPVEGGVFLAIPARAFESGAAVGEAMAAIRRHIADARPLQEEIIETQVTFKPCPKDMLEIQKRRQIRNYGALYPIVWVLNSWICQIPVFAVLLGLLAWSLIEAIGFRDPGGWVGAAVISFALLLQPPTYHIAGKVSRFVRFRVKRDLYGEDAVKTLALTPEALIDRSPFSSGRIKWAVVEDILETRSCLYFVLSDYMAVAAPKRAFPDEASFRAFLDKAREYKAMAQAAPQLQAPAAAE